MKKERMYGKFDIVHTCTSHTDTLWKHELTVDPSIKKQLKTASKKSKKPSANTPHATLMFLSG